MKKSFMTRVLAMGLSFAMAFSLSAATNVTTASAAAKKVKVTTMMKVPTKSVVEGKTVKTYMNGPALEKYRIKRVAKLSATADKYIDVDVITSGPKNRQGLKITAHEGAVTAAKLTKKGVYVTIYFAETTLPSKAAKAPAKKYAKLKVAVQAKPVEKTTMTAAATKVKEITLTFSKAVKDTAAAKVVVKKGNATPTFTATWAEDAKSVKLAMDSKLTKGTYDVTVSGVDKDDLTASITVEDQKLTDFVFVSDKLVADAKVSTTASIYFRAVDQYGQNIAGVSPTVSTSYSNKASSATSKVGENTKITVENILPTLAILGTKGTVTVVDNKTGVNKTVDVVYSAPAKASKVELVSLYNVSTAKKLDSLTAGDKGENIKVVLKFTDQYGTEMAAKDVANITVNAAAGTTNVALASEHEIITIDEKDYVAVPLKNELKAGSFQLTIVNSQVGLLDNMNFDVAPGTVIKTFSVSAAEDIYAGEKATLSYVAVDADGKEVTSYDVLSKALKGGLASGAAVEKQKDGSAKLTYTPVPQVSSPDKDNKRGSDNVTLTFQVYPNTTNIIVVNTSIRVNEKRVFWEVSGVNADKAIAGNEGDQLDFKAEDFKISDQYGNTLSKDKINELIGTSNQLTAAAIAEGNKDNWTLVLKPLTGKKVTFAAIVSKSGISKIKVYPTANPKGSDNGYDLTLSQVKSDKAASFEIKWNDDVNTFCVSNGGIDAAKMIKKFKVVGKVGGKTVTIPDSNYAITGLTGADKLGDPDEPTIGKKTVEGTVTVTVNTTDDNGKNVANEVTAKFTCSNEKPALASIKADSDLTISTGSSVGTVKVSDLAEGFKLKDQYGNAIDSTGVAATVTILSSANTTADVKYNGTTSCELNNMKLGDKISVTLTKGDLTATREEVTLKLSE